MAKYTIASDYCSVFGMDVHARSITVKGRDLSTGRSKVKRFGDCPTAETLLEWMSSQFTAPYYAAYESGCTGFQLARDLRGLGVACDVIAVSSIARSDEDRKLKNDRRDAARVLSELLNPESRISAVWVPDPECEAARDLVRCTLDAVKAMRSSKQHVSAMLLRHGWVWNERTAAGNLRATWTRGYVKWAKSADLGEPAANEALRRCILIAEEDAGRVDELKAELRKLAALPRWKPYVDAISLIKGVDWFGALLAAAEIGDFDRFGGGRGGRRLRQGLQAAEIAVRPLRRGRDARQQGEGRRRQRARTLDLGRREDGPGRAARPRGAAIVEASPGEGVQPMGEPALDTCAPPPATAGAGRHARD